MHVKLTLGTSRQPLRTGVPLEVECAACGTALDVHQPDPGRPERLLGTCAECGGWFLILTTDESDTALLLQLPSEVEIARQAGSSPSATAKAESSVSTSPSSSCRP